MAIDTENKRRSVVYILPVPDSTIDQADRQQAIWIYSGILAAATTAVTPSPLRIFTVLAERERIFAVLSEDRIFEASEPL